MTEIKEPDKVPAVDIEDGEAQHINHLLDIAEACFERPRFKALRAAAEMQLAELADKKQVELDEWDRANKEREAEIARLWAEERERERIEAEEAAKVEQQVPPSPPRPALRTNPSPSTEPPDRRA